MKSLSDLPKDLLVKLILTVEKITKTSVQSVCEKRFDRENKIYKFVTETIRQVRYGRIVRCDFPGCREVDIQDLNEEDKLNSCMWIIRDQKVKYYCDAHDTLNYIKKFDDYDGEDINPCCDDCLERELKHGYIITKKDTSKVDKTKVRKQLEEDELRRKKENIEKNKIRNYYDMSKLILINKIFHVGNEIRKEVIEEYHKEINLRNHIVKGVKRLDRGMFSVINCDFYGCENFIVRSSHTGQCFYYNNISGESCIECDKIYYCEKHMFHFPIIFKSRDEELFCCCCNNCRDKEEEKGSQLHYCANDPNLIKIKS